MAKTIPKDNGALIQEVMRMASEFCSEEHPAITFVFCKEQEASTNPKELEWFCNNQCQIHRLQTELVCLDYSVLEKLKAHFSKK